MNTGGVPEANQACCIWWQYGPWTSTETGCCRATDPDIFPASIPGWKVTMALEYIEIGISLVVEWTLDTNMAPGRGQDSIPIQFLLVIGIMEIKTYLGYVGSLT